MDDWALADQDLRRHLAAAYGQRVAAIEPVGGGADYNARAFRVTADDGTPYFLKVRRAPAGEASLLVPHFLHAQGLRQVLAPLAARGGALATRLQGADVILYPFRPGRNAMEAGMTPQQWTELGAAVRAYHSIALPERLRSLMPREAFSPRFRRAACGYLQRALAGEYDQGAGRGLAEVLRRHRAEIEHMLSRATRLADALAGGEPRPAVVCHADLHRWNIQVDAEGRLLIVDWDSLRLAPRECDLMFIGGRIGGDTGDTAEEPAFYRGYDGAPPDPAALAYYRYERILTDIAEYSRAVWDVPDMTGAGAREAARRVAGNFSRGSEYEAARRADPEA
jgi:spectinomycin phosphotransferase